MVIQVEQNLLLCFRHQTRVWSSKWSKTHFCVSGTNHWLPGHVHIPNCGSAINQDSCVGKGKTKAPPDKKGTGLFCVTEWPVWYRPVFVLGSVSQTGLCCQKCFSRMVCVAESGLCCLEHFIEMFAVFRDTPQNGLLCWECLTDWFVFFREEPCLRVTHSLPLWGLLVKVRVSFYSFCLPIVRLLLWLVLHGAVCVCV